MPRPPALPCPEGLGARSGSEPGAELRRAAGAAEQSASPASPPHRPLRHQTSGPGRSRRQDEAPGAEERPSDKELAEGSPRRSPLPPPTSPPSGWRGSAPRGAAPGPRATAAMLDCSCRPQPAPSARDTPKGFPRLWPAGHADKGERYRGAGGWGGGRTRNEGGKTPETRRAGSGARANSGEDASALSLLCISSTRKANSSAEGLNQAFI